MPISAIKENLSFMLTEVQQQTEAALHILQHGDLSEFQKINSRDDYVDNLKTIIERRCFGLLSESTQISRRETDTIQAIHTICVNLERIGDFCVSAADQLHYLHDHALLQRFDYQRIFAIIAEHLEQVLPVLEKGEMAKALAICRAENLIDIAYKENFDQIMDDLRGGRNTENLITVLFIFRYLERMGDALLNIGEALLLAILGEKIKIDQFQVLEETLHRTGACGSLSELDFSSILGSRSGCRIRKLQQGNDQHLLPQIQSSIFKEGNRDKILAEKRNIEQWENLFPGLAPKIFSSREDAETASLLVEFIPGRTLEEIILNGELQELQECWLVLATTVRAVWQQTRHEQVVNCYAVQQIMARLNSILAIHPDFHRVRQDIGKSKIISTDELLEKCLSLEDELAAPFSVFIHGDFNVNNIIHNDREKRIQFIDLYRSKPADYVQDVSVFIISNFRQPVFQVQLRDRLNWVSRKMYELAKSFAHEQTDSTFEARMALALARSFYTSTRFALNNDFAHEMFLRSHFLLEKILTHKGRPWEKFKLPDGIMFY